MADTAAAILKIFKPHLQGNREIQNYSMVPFRNRRGLPWRPSWIVFKYHFPNLKSDRAETWWETLGRHEDSELLKSFRSDIQVGRHGGHLEILQTTSPPKPCVGLSWNFGGIGATWIFRTVKIVPFRYQRWPVSRIAQKLGGRHRGKMEIWNC